MSFDFNFSEFVQIDKIPALVQLMAWRRPDDKPLSETMMVRFPSFGVNELKQTRPKGDQRDILSVNVGAKPMPNIEIEKKK